jgi:hypothetical protein
MKNILNSIHFIWLLSFVIITGCSSVKIDVESKGDAEYIRFETYGWLKTGKQIANYNRVDNKELETNIYATIKQIMDEKGYQFLAEGDPDILITFYAGVTGEIINDESGYTYAQWFDGTREVSQNGLLLIDLIDNENRILFWRGKGSGLMDDQDSAASSVEMICRKILNDYPDRSEDE